MSYARHMSTLQSVPWTLGDYLRKARESSGKTQKEFAQAMGISRSSVIAYEKDETIPRRPVLLAWALASGWPLELLTEPLGGDDGGGSDQAIPSSRCIVQLRAA